MGVRPGQRASPIIARFERYGDRELAMRNAKKLRGTEIYFNDDLCPQSQEKRRQQLLLLKQARREGKIAYFRYTKLAIRGKRGIQGDNARGSSADAAATTAGVGTTSCVSTAVNTSNVTSVTQGRTTSPSAGSGEVLTGSTSSGSDKRILRQ